MTTTISIGTYLGSWLWDEPANGSDMFPAFACFNGSCDMVEVYEAKAKSIRASDLSEFANPAAKKQAALQAFTRQLLAERSQRLQPLLDRVAATITANQ